jgi:hypothetical protein
VQDQKREVVRLEAALAEKQALLDAAQRQANALLESVRHPARGAGVGAVGDGSAGADAGADAALALPSAAHAAELAAVRRAAREDAEKARENFGSQLERLRNVRSDACCDHEGAALRGVMNWVRVADAACGRAGGHARTARGG